MNTTQKLSSILLTLALSWCGWSKSDTNQSVSTVLAQTNITPESFSRQRANNCATGCHQHTSSRPQTINTMTQRHNITTETAEFILSQSERAGDRCITPLSGFPGVRTTTHQLTGNLKGTTDIFGIMWPNGMKSARMIRIQNWTSFNVSIVLGNKNLTECWPNGFDLDSLIDYLTG